MIERPILFSGPMVRAILNGTKTVTRRVIKQATGPSLSVEMLESGQALLSWLVGHGPGHEVGEQLKFVDCPYGKVGDRLWVRESFWGCDLPGHGDQPCVVYDDEWEGKEYRPAEARPWARKFGRIPSIHMPRECSRILLEITAVRVERLQDISEEQAEAEGTQGCVPYCQSPYDSDGAPACDCMNLTYKESFQALWHSINGTKSWDANPWVWVVEFNRVTV